MRLCPRILVSISAFADKARARHAVIITDLGTEGMFLKYRSAMEVQEGERLVIRYRLYGSAIMKQRVRVVRKEEGGCGIRFLDIESTARQSIWDYISRELSHRSSVVCPFCGTATGEKKSTCPRCLCSLEFERPGYFEYLERMSLFRRLEADVDRLQSGQIQGLALFGLASFFAETIEAHVY